MDTDENNFETRVKDETEKLKEEREAELNKVILMELLVRCFTRSQRLKESNIVSDPF